MFSRNCAYPSIVAMVLFQLPIEHADTTALDSELERVVKILKRSVEAGQSVRVEPFSDLTAGSDLSGSIRTGLSEAFKLSDLLPGNPIEFLTIRYDR